MKTSVANVYQQKSRLLENMRQEFDRLRGELDVL
jgi:hypothetical protein